MTARVFAPPLAACEAGRIIELDEEETHYLERVRRLAHSETFEVIQVASACWRARYAGTSGRRWSAHLVEQLATPRGVPHVTLLLGMPDARAVEELVPGIVELGVARLALVHARFSPKRVPDPARLSRLVRAAMRQCGRYEELAVDLPTSLDAALSLSSQRQQRLSSSDGAALSSASALLVGIIGIVREQGPPPRKPIATQSARIVAVGPEGGWSDAEADACIERGLSPVSVSPFVLRTPTAALALSTMALLPNVEAAHLR